MRVVLQKVSEATVAVNAETVGKIGAGFLLYVGFTKGDTEKQVTQMAAKVSKLRIFPDENDKMNRSLTDVSGDILSVSQFTLYASTKKENRPSFTDALDPELAVLLYEQFNNELSALGFAVSTGVFGAHMQVASVNDGPSTFLLDI